MIKMLLKWFSMASLVFLGAPAFAAPTYTATLMPISQAMNSHDHHAENGWATHIVVVNFTANEIVVSKPTDLYISAHQAGSIVDSAWGYRSYVELLKPSREYIWAQDVGPYDIVAVHCDDNDHCGPGSHYVVTATPP